MPTGDAPEVAVASGVATVDVRELTGEGAVFGRAAATLGASLVETGFVKVAGHAVAPERLAAAYAAAEAVFSLPPEVLAGYVRPELHGARGLVPFGREKAKDASIADLKEFWHVGPTGADPANVWPEEVPAFAETMAELHASLACTSELLLEALAVHLGLGRRHLADLVVGADSILRVLHYPPVPDGAPAGAVRSAAHEDINFITLLPAATADGLQLLDRDGRWCRVDAEPGELVVDAGDQLSIHLGGRVPATTHRVVNPGDPATHRYSMPFFCQPRPEVVLGPPPSVLTAGQYHAQRMEDIRAGRL
jgi:isopenicillin N synthase-like dioxygenase